MGRFSIALLIDQTVLSMDKASCSSWDASIEILMKHLPSNWSRISSTHSMVINLINPTWNGSGICGICLNTPKWKVEEVSLLARNNPLFGRVPVSDGVLE